MKKNYFGVMIKMEESKKKIHVLKKKPYSNCRVLDMDGILLFRCSTKKAEWYLKNSLAVELQKEPLIVRLLFKPKGSGDRDDPYLLNDKFNICVVCGTETDLSKHHIVPRCYRVHFPVEMKDHNSHDVLPMCFSHHVEYEEEAFKIKLELANRYDAPLNGGETHRNMARVNRAYGYARNLVLFAGEIPDERAQQMRSYIRKTLEIQHMDDDTLLMLAQEKSNGNGNLFGPLHGELVTSRIGDIDEFVRMWRQHFVDTMNPRHMPTGWSVDYKKVVDV
jgi:exonuclease 3'-5' domain-containing protein 2